MALGAFAATPKYVFLFIGDGMSTPQRMIAEEFSRKVGNGSLAMNTLPYQATTRTCSANSLVTDSAAAATAIACGVKTYNHAIGVDAKAKPAESCAEVAKKAGKKVGIVSTVTITHATPGGFYAHRKNRGELYGIALDLANSGFDFFAGGGLDQQPNAKKNKDYAKYGDAYDYVAKKGYRIVRTKDEFMALKPSDGKIMTRFTNGPLETTIDATSDLNQPTLAEIVGKAIEMLDGPQGFFLMAEGGRIDWAGHANDAATNLRDVLALDEAVKVALAFLDKHPKETLVIVTGDHETGGMSMGFAGIGGKFKVDLLAKQTISVERFSNEFKDLISKRKGEIAFDEMVPVLEEKFGLANLSNQESETLRKAFDQDVLNVRNKLKDTTAHDVARRYVFAQAVKNALNARAGIGWSSGGHTALPTFTTAKGAGAEMLIGIEENTDIGKRLKELLSK